MSKSLKAIQILSKIGKILSKIIFICCIVGAAGCLIGAISIGILGETKFTLGSTEFILSTIDINKFSFTNALCGATAGFVFCLAEGVLAKFANLYFVNELKAGTPFTKEGANEMLRLGILTCAISLITTIVVAILIEVIPFVLKSECTIDFDLGGQIGLGIAFIIISVLCRYGSECAEAKN